jgi:hypothetical protein
VPLTVTLYKRANLFFLKKKLCRAFSNIQINGFEIVNWHLEVEELSMRYELENMHKSILSVFNLLINKENTAVTRADVFF